MHSLLDTDYDGSPMILGLDVSTVTGWCEWRREQTNVAEIQFKKFSGMKRALAFSDWLSGRLDSCKPELVVFEGYGFGQLSSVQVLVEIGTLMRAVTYCSGIPYVDVPPMSLKKFTTGKGTAKKDEMMLWVYKRWGFEAKTNNEADAFALAMVGRAMLGQLENMTVVQQEVLKKLAVSPTI